MVSPEFFQLFHFYYFTFTIITFFFPSLVFTVILHLPFFNALITPFFVTLAIFLLEERYIILAVEDAGSFLACILYFFPFFKVTFVFFTFKDFVFIVSLTVEPEAGFVSDFFSEAAGFVFELFPESPGLLFGLSSELPGFVLSSSSEPFTSITYLLTSGTFVILDQYNSEIVP